MWPYLVLLVAWGVFLWSIGGFFEIDWLINMGMLMLAAAVIIGAFYGSYTYLLWAEVWPFQPQ